MPLNFLRFFGLQRVDLRLHRKTIVIDRRVAYTGSLNMVDPDCFAEAKTVGAWIDAMVRTEGPAVRELEGIFLTDWALQPDGDPSDMDPLPLNDLYEQPGEATTVVVPSGPLLSHNTGQSLLLEAINAARFSLCITTPYFIPSEALAAALEVAARRGVKVTLIIPELADSRTVTYAGRRYFDDLLTAGIRILLYRGGLLHTKSIAVDDTYAVFGTVNFDNRSIQLDFEVSMLIFDEQFMADIKKLHQHYAEQCREIDPSQWRHRPISDRLKEGASYLLSPLL
jgi:cardiolipin synthase